MFDAARWSDLVAGRDCAACRDNARAPHDQPGFVCDLRSGRVILQDDAAFPGYCVLYHCRHAVELFELDRAERNTFSDDVSSIAAAISRVCKPPKLNYAMLGNELPHLHCHVIPRYPNDGWWGRAIWLRPAGERRAMSPDEFAALRDRLRAEFAGE